MEKFDIAIIGAGKTGRGFIGRLLQDNQLRFLLIDKDPKLVEALEKEGSFDVRFFGEARPPVIVNNFKAMHTKDPNISYSISEARLIFVSVGGSNIEEAAAWLAGTGICSGRKPEYECTIILCENANKPAERFKKAFLANLNEKEKIYAQTSIGFSEATIFCTTIENQQAPLGILSENYPYLQCDAEPLKPDMPKFQGLVPIYGFDNFLIRKIYTYNAASAAISYLGWWKGYKIYSEAANDAEILKILENLYSEVGKAMCKEYGYTEDDQREFAELSLKKFMSKTIVDTIARNARDPVRKLKSNERIIGPALLIDKYGGNYDTLAMTAAAALLYEDPDDEKWSSFKKENSPEKILEEVSGLKPESPIFMRIIYHCDRLEKIGRCRL